MPTRFHLYRFTKKTPLSDEVFNKIFADIDLRIAKLEDIEKDWQYATNEITRFGLARIEEILRPSWEHLQQKKSQADAIVAEIQEKRDSADAIINASRDEVLEQIQRARSEALNDIQSAKEQAISQFDLNKLYAMTFFFGGD